MAANTLELYTLGYEGRSIEKYVKLLQVYQVKSCCDVRKDPVSRKRGFSKKSMERHLQSNGIAYRHFPSLGVPKEKRDSVTDQQSLQQLWEWYQHQVLEKNEPVLAMIEELLQEKGRIALTCYERDVRQCHRLLVAQHLHQRGPSLTVHHL